VSDDHLLVERMLGTAVDPGYPVRVHTFVAPGELDYQVRYAAVDIPMDALPALLDAAGLTTAEAAAYSLVMLPSGWFTEPGDPPEWWPTDPASLADQTVRPASPSGWLVAGHQGGTLYVLATSAG